MNNKPNAFLSPTVLLFVSVFLTGLIVLIGGSKVQGNIKYPRPDVLGVNSSENSSPSSIEQCNTILNDKLFKESYLESDPEKNEKSLSLSKYQINGYNSGYCLYIVENGKLVSSGVLTK